MIQKGSKICSNVKCGKSKELCTFEINFGYIERGAKKNALVKVRCCPKCSNKLNYKKQHKRIEEQKNKHKSGKRKEKDKKKGRYKTDDIDVFRS